MRVRYSFSAKMTGKYRKNPSTNEHRVEFPKLVRDVIRTSDIILEVLDARFIDKTRNLEMEREVLVQGKKLIFVLNKADLIDIKELKENYDLGSLGNYILFSCKSKIGRSRLRTLIKIEVKKLKMGGKRARVGIIGYPNTGKSSLINILSAKKATSTSPQAGHTKAMHKIRFNKDIVILDTPGVYMESEKPELEEAALKKHAFIGIQDYSSVKNPEFIVAELIKSYPGMLESFYGIEANGDSEILIDKLGEKLNFKKKGNVVDRDRTARRIIRDWQEEKIK